MAASRPSSRLTKADIETINNAFLEAQGQLGTTKYGGHPDQLKAAVSMFDKWPQIYLFLLNGDKL